jgi:hypothetical protein
MNLFQQFQSKLNENFNLQKPLNTGKLAPRNGYYYVRSIEYQEKGIHGKVAIANVNWKAIPGDKFLEEAVFQIVVERLYPDLSSDEKYKNIHQLVGKSFYIYQTGLMHTIENGLQKALVSVKWEYLYEPPTFINEKTLSLNLFFNGANTLLGAWDRFASTATYNVSAALEEEAAGDRLDYDGDCDSYGFDYDDDDPTPVETE